MSKEFGKRLRTLRIEKGIYQSEIAELLHTKQNTISRWEKGEVEPNIEQIIELACYFDVTTDYLLGLENYIKNRKHA